jgi:cbb3-type cytochrome oxidase maturation protein
MSIIYVLIPLAIIIVGIAIVVFFWAVRSNQFEDLDRQGYSILFDDDISKKATNTPPKSDVQDKRRTLSANDSKPNTDDNK